MFRLVLAQVLLGAVAVTVVTSQIAHGASGPVALRSARATPSNVPGAAGALSRSAQAALPAGGAPTPTTTTAPPGGVAPVGTLRPPSAVVTLPAAVTGAQLKAFQAIRGVGAVEVVDAGTIGFQGAPTMTVGVDPSTFRNFTPSVTAASDRLWQYIATGTVASSFEMSRDRKLTLGANVAVAAAGSGTMHQVWLGAFLSVGLPGVDLVVNRQMSPSLGLARDSALIVSAPSVDPFALETALKSIAPGASVALVRPGLALGTSGGGSGSLSPSQLSTALTAALSRVGKPYLWGATGPDDFDCSGLVGWAFAAAGVDLPRTAAEQALAGPSVPLKNIQPGDLLFWAFDPADPGFVDHVAIYLGGGQMIEAPFTGAWVHIVAVPTTHLVGAVRVSPPVAARLGSPWRQG